MASFNSFCSNISSQNSELSVMSCNVGFDPEPGTQTQTQTQSQTQTSSFSQCDSQVLRSVHNICAQRRKRRSRSMSHRLSMAMNEKTPTFQRRRSSSISHSASMQLFSSSAVLSNIQSQRNDKQEADEEDFEEDDEKQLEVESTIGEHAKPKRKPRKHQEKNENSRKKRKKKKSGTARFSNVVIPKRINLNVTANGIAYRKNLKIINNGEQPIKIRILNDSALYSVNIDNVETRLRPNSSYSVPLRPNNLLIKKRGREIKHSASRLRIILFSNDKQHSKRKKVKIKFKVSSQ